MLNDVFPEKVKYHQSVWEAENKRIDSEEKAMESLRKVMHDQGTPIPANAKDQQLQIDRYQNNARLRTAMMQIMMGGR